MIRIFCMTATGTSPAHRLQQLAATASRGSSLLWMMAVQTMTASMAGALLLMSLACAAHTVGVALIYVGFPPTTATQLPTQGYEE